MAAAVVSLKPERGQVLFLVIYESICNSYEAQLTGQINEVRPEKVGGEDATATLAGVLLNVERRGDSILETAIIFELWVSNLDAVV